MIINEYSGLYYIAFNAREQLSQDIAEANIDKPSKRQRRKPSRFASLVKRKAK
ncbi:hypothetical protein [Vibrio sp. WXL103]|uniref:hypothetical protein n=1 Tax=unclassified Vibrio TaxID=2614977 RepID=UPI003EC8985A